MAQSRRSDPALLQTTGRFPEQGHGSPRRWAVIWGAFGFVIGTLFWSAAGFGPSPRVFALALGPEHTSSIPADVASKPADRVPAAVARVGDAEINCTALLLDRAVQQTRLGHCSTDDPPLRYAESAGRQDRLGALE